MKTFDELTYADVEGENYQAKGFVVFFHGEWHGFAVLGRRLSAFFFN